MFSNIWANIQRPKFKISVTITWNFSQAVQSKQVSKYPQSDDGKHANINQGCQYWS